MISPYFSDGQVSLYLGNCLDVLPNLPDNSVDAVITDGPYGLAELSTATVLQAIAAWMAGDRNHVPDGKGFMSREWDRFVPPPGVWDQCLRVLKPGGHLLAFAAPRTQDLMGLSIRIAGFEIRDGIDWIYGNGFPKSHDVSKAIDKIADAARTVIGTAADFARDGARRTLITEAVPHGRQGGHGYRDRWSTPVTVATSDSAREWAGWGTALKPAHEPIIVARKLLPQPVAANLLEHSTGAINVDACRIEVDERPLRLSNRHPGPGNNVYSDGLQGSYAAGVTSVGRWPTNLVFSHSPACNDVCVAGCPVADLGENARFFPVFRYEAKAPASERPRLDDGTTWPTVKPLELVRWLCRLVTPPGGLIIDPFCGTGVTGEAAIVEGFHCILIDQDPVAAELTTVRLKKPIQPSLFGLEAS